MCLGPEMIGFGRNLIQPLRKIAAAWWARSRGPSSMLPGMDLPLGPPPQPASWGGRVPRAGSRRGLESRETALRGRVPVRRAARAQIPREERPASVKHFLWERPPPPGD